MSSRSYLYVPGDQRAMLDKSAGRGADAVIIDLEDGVAPVAKKAARALAAALLDGLTGGEGIEWWVRCNAGTAVDDDLAAVIRPGLTGVLLPKVERRDDLDRLDEKLTRREEVAGLVPGSLVVVPLVESGAGLLALEAIATAPRVAHLSLGEVDLAADLGLPAETDQSLAAPIDLARSQLVITSAAARIDSPVGSASTNFRDLEAFRAGTTALRRAGFFGRKAIHPAQVPVINEIFSLTEAEIASATELVAAYDSAVAEGHGAIVDASGRMVDEAVVRIARRTLRRVGRARSTG